MVRGGRLLRHHLWPLRQELRCSTRAADLQPTPLTRPPALHAHCFDTIRRHPNPLSPALPDAVLKLVSPRPLSSAMLHTPATPVLSTCASHFTPNPLLLAITPLFPLVQGAQPATCAPCLVASGCPPPRALPLPAPRNAPPMTTARTVAPCPAPSGLLNPASTARHVTCCPATLQAAPVTRSFTSGKALALQWDAAALGLPQHGCTRGATLEGGPPTANQGCAREGY